MHGRHAYTIFRSSHRPTNRVSIAQTAPVLVPLVDERNDGLPSRSSFYTPVVWQDFVLERDSRERSRRWASEQKDVFFRVYVYDLLLLEAFENGRIVKLERTSYPG